MLIRSGRHWLPVVLVVVSASLIGCDLDTLPDDAVNGASTSSGENGAAPVIGTGGGGEQPEPATTDPPDPATVNPPDAQSGEPPEPGDNARPDFAVVDVNADSPRYQELVSPRDYLGQVSAWYFGHST